MLCMECGAEMRKCSDSVDAEYRGEKITVHGVEHYVCDTCGEIVFDAEDGKKYDAEVIRRYATIHDLLSADEIRAIRKGAGLTQRDFEKVIGVSSPSVSRWETGRVLQSKPLDLLMRAYRNAPELMRARIEQCEIRVSDKRAEVVRFPKMTSGKRGDRGKQPSRTVASLASNRIEPAWEM